MKKASISILKAHLSRYVDAVKSGEEVIVTERGRPVARLSALDLDRAPEGRVAKLLREGRMRAPRGRGHRPLRRSTCFKRGAPTRRDAPWRTSAGSPPRPPGRVSR